MTGGDVDGKRLSPGGEGDNEDLKPIVLTGKGRVPGSEEDEGVLLSPVRSEQVTSDSEKATAIVALRRIIQQLQENGEEMERKKTKLSQLLNTLTSTENAKDIPGLLQQIDQLLNETQA